MKLNIDFVRKQFPALSGDWVFLDNAGGTQVLQQVAARIQDYLLTTNVQLGATYDVSRRSTERTAAAPKTIAELINAQEHCEVILGSSTSLLLKNLSLSLGEVFKPGDEVIVTNCDHEANIGPWRNLEKKGITIKEWRLNPDTLDLHLEDLEALMTDKTRLVALTHISNILGTINPIKKIAAFIHDRGAMICVDGVAYAPHRLVDVRDTNVDFYAFSFYKVYGPHYSMLYGKKNHLENIPGINHFFLEEDIPLKFQPGNVNYELSYGLLGIADYFREFARVHAADQAGLMYQAGQASQRETDLKTSAALAYDCIARYEETLSARLLDFLNSKANVRVIGKRAADDTQRVPTISFVIDKVKSSAITLEVDKHKIGIRYGDFYARRLIRDLGLTDRDGVVRVSMVHYNTLEELDRLIRIFDTLF